MGYKGFSIISMIPARGLSKGISRKNIKLLADKPLIVYSIEDSLESKYVDRTIVFTEDDEIAKVSLSFGAEFYPEPYELAQDNILTELPMLDVLKQLEAEGYVPDYVVLLEPTGIFRRRFDVDKAIEKIIVENGDSLLSVYESNVFFWSRQGEPLNYDYRKRPQRQHKKWEFVENGSIFITRTNLLLREKCRLGGKILFYEMPQAISCEIDTPFDLLMAECKLRQKEIREILEL